MSATADMGVQSIVVPGQVPIVTVKCFGCGTEAIKKVDKRGTPRLPRGWVIFDVPNVFCAKCWKDKYYPSTITFPVVRPINVSWNDFKLMVAKGWHDSTILANELTRRLYALEPPITAEMTEWIGKYPGKGLNVYQLGKEIAPNMNRGAMSVAVRAIKAHYERVRKAVLWRGDEFPRYSYPYPCDLRAQELRAEIRQDTRGKTLVEFPMLRAVFGTTSVELRLKSGKKYRRSFNLFKRIVSGEVKLGDARIIGKRANWGDHREAIFSRTEKGRNKIYARINVQLSVYIPRDTSGVNHKFEKIMLVKTDQFSLLTFMIHESHVHRLNGDEMRRKLNAFAKQMEPKYLKKKIDRHARILRRTSDDKKFLRRKGQRLSIDDVRAEIAASHARWMNNWLNIVTRRLVDFALRNHITEIQYNDDCKLFTKMFAWYKLKELLCQKAERVGLKFIDASKPDPAEDQQSSGNVQ